MPSDLDADVLVVGGGLAGYGAAHRLAGHGHAVLVLEAGPVPGGGFAVRLRLPVAPPLADVAHAGARVVEAR